MIRMQVAEHVMNN